MVIAGCNRTDDLPADNTIQFQIDDTDVFVSDSVNYIDFVVLMSDSANLIGNIDKVFVYDDCIYVGDFTSQKVHIYDLSGNLTSILNHRGRGPGEYVGIQNFVVSGNYIYVYDFYQNKILVYNSQNSSFLYDLDLPFLISDFEVLTNGDFLFACTPSIGDPKIDPDLRYRLIITDSQLNINDKHLKYDNEESDAYIFPKFRRKQNFLPDSV